MMLRPFLSVLSLMVCVPSSYADSPGGWELAGEIEARVSAPTFPDRDFPITDYGATADGQSDCRAAIAQAIDACHNAGGGRVVVGAGDWAVAGPVHLKSNVNLHLAEGATLLFSTTPSDYLPMVLTRFEGTELMNYSPPIYAYEQENIALTGKGVIDGQAGEDNWWEWKTVAAGDAQVEKLRQQAEDDVPAREREYGEGKMIRPNFVQPYRCKNVLIEGITVHRSPMWCLNPVLSENVTVRGVTVDSHGPNNDGCNPESCKYVLIEDCLFDTGDDCIAIKSGRNADGRRIGRPSEMILIRNCQMRDGHGGVVLGSEMSGGVRNVFVEDCRMDSPNLDRAIRLKSNSLRGGYLENMYVRNVEVGQVGDAVIRINLRYWGETGEHFPQVRNIFIRNLTAKKSRRAFYLIGLPERPIENVVVEDCTLSGAAEPSVIEHVEGLSLKNVTLPERD